jgi:hypothetical protein
MEQLSLVRLAKGNTAKTRPFSHISGSPDWSFSAVETVWRRKQSGANPSPSQFPANREKYRVSGLKLGPDSGDGERNPAHLEGVTELNSPIWRKKAGNYKSLIREYILLIKELEFPLEVAMSLPAKNVSLS